MWITPNPADFKARLISDVELEIIMDGIPAGTTVDQVSAEAYTTIILKIRRAVGAGGGTVGADGEIPDELSDELEALVMRKVFGRLTGGAADKLYTKNRTQAALEAVESLKEVSRNAKGIVPPAVEAPVQPSNATASAVVVQQMPRLGDRQSMGGLL